LSRAARRTRAGNTWPARLAELGIGAGWLIGISAALRVLDTLLGQAPLASALLGAILVDLAAGRAGVRWDELTSEDGTRHRGSPRPSSGAWGSAC